jgi:hypothetical protein
MVERLVAFFAWLGRLFVAPVRPGSAVMLDADGPRRRFGTFGCVVRQDGKRYILSCAHVFQGGKRGDPVRLYDVDGDRTKRRLGALAHTPSRDAHSIDCALVAIEWSARVRASFPPPVGSAVGEPFPVDDLRIVPNNRIAGRVDVQAFGATTPYTRGGASFGVFSILSSRSPRSRKSEWKTEPPLIIIKPALDSNLDFCAEGDSGALVLTVGSAGHPARPLGLLVATDDDGIGRFGYAIPIGRVLDALKVRIDPG